MNTIILWAILCVSSVSLGFALRSSRKRKAKIQISSTDPRPAGEAVVRAHRHGSEPVGDDSLSRLQTFAVKTCRDCPMLVEVSGNVLHALTGSSTLTGDQLTMEGPTLYLCAGDGEWADPDLVPGHGCDLFDEGPMLAYLVTPR